MNKYCHDCSWVWLILKVDSFHSGGYAFNTLFEMIEVLQVNLLASAKVLS